MMRTGYKIPTEADIQSERALYNILEPRYHHLVPEWMKTATDAEKQGVIKLARISEPKLLKTIGRPRMDSFEPTLKEHAWYHKRGNPALRPRVDTIEKFPMDPAEYQVPSWLNEDLYEAEQIPKPGGCILKLKDSINIMRQKNWTRNQGTYQMFSGSFDGTTTTGSCYTLDAIDLALAEQVIARARLPSAAPTFLSTGAAEIMAFHVSHWYRAPHAEASGLGFLSLAG
eukprot:CAMPEP_0181483712 /NCGR_PEP_ID=MMETSP1110-20121109/45577_1 /TAXON_ID=174948 /ORGANISM="Symbiodinium sp., Strain CCMP421" /LENGTH=227 /DNA_ID=CAMNT_0023609461 /DNA_START=76 /DNA_END=755 /DNA_ORIENTATION=-